MTCPNSWINAKASTRCGLFVGQGSLWFMDLKRSHQCSRKPGHLGRCWCRCGSTTRDSPEALRRFAGGVRPRYRKVGPVVKRLNPFLEK